MNQKGVNVHTCTILYQLTTNHDNCSCCKIVCIYLANSFSSLLLTNESEEHEDDDDDDYINLVVVVEEGAIEIVAVLLVITSDKLTQKNAR